MTIKKVGVVGCGFMGSGIAQVCAQTEYQVLINDINEDILRKGINSINNFLARSVEKGRITREDQATTMDRIKGTINIKDLHNCDLIIEAVPEVIDLKKKVFTELDRICPDNVVLATNTSTISVNEIGKTTSRPEKVIGTHFLSPVPISKLLEIVVSKDTGPETLTIVKEFGASLGKELIVARDTPGFVFNYMLAALTQSALGLLENGIATKEDIDKAMVLGLGHPIGPIALMDFNGLDTAYLVLQALYNRTKDSHHKPSVLLKKLVEEGCLGRKTGKGFYDYPQ